MYTKVKKSHENGVCYPVTIDAVIDRAYGENVDDFMVTLRYKVKVK